MNGLSGGGMVNGLDIANCATDQDGNRGAARGARGQAHDLRQKRADNQRESLAETSGVE